MNDEQKIKRMRKILIKCGDTIPLMIEKAPGKFSTDFRDEIDEILDEIEYILFPGFWEER